MKAILDTFVRDDFGKEYCLILLKGRKRTFIQTSVGWCDEPCSPLLHFTMGSSGLVSFFFYIYKFSFCLDLITYNWHKDI